MRLTEQVQVAYESTFGSLAIDASSRTPGGPETPFRIAVLADLSGRQGREAPASGADILARKPVKVTHDSLDDAIESLEPRLEYTVAGGDVSVSLEFREFDDFQPDPIARQVDRVTDLDDNGASELMREILHHPQYQLVESAWRGVEWLLKRVQKSDRIQVVLFDITAEELAADLMSGDDLGATAIYGLLIDKTAEAPDGQPWAAIVGNYTFEETTEHAELLGRMAKVAARAGAPLLTRITSKSVQEGYEAPADGKPAWLALRALYESAYLALATPGFLLRPPFGENYRPAESFRFEEFSGTPEGYLWGNPGFACAALLAMGYMKSGWGFQPNQTLTLDNMPMHTYRDAEGEAVAMCAEARFTSSVGEELSKRGLMPLLAVRGRDSVELAAIRALAAESKTLNGRWQGGQGGPPPTSGLPKVSVGMMSKGQSSGRAPPSREGPAFVSAEPTARPAARHDDPEVDPDLAALLAGDQVPSDEAPPQNPDESPPSEESLPSEGNGDDVALDPELAALLAGGDEPPAEESVPELDPELAALLGETPGGDAPPTDEPAAEELDAELAALLGGSGGGETSAPEEPLAEELDPDLAALLGETPAAADEPSMDDQIPSDDDIAPADEAPAEETATTAEELDPDLAALLGGDSSEPADEAPVETNGDELDPDLAALLGDSSAEPEAQTEETPADLEPVAASDELDPGLAALLGDSSPEPAEEQVAAVEDELPAFDEPTEEPAETFSSAANELAGEPEPELEPEPEPEMATATDDRPDLDRDEEFSSTETRSASAMAQDLDSLIQQIQEVSKYGGPGSGSPAVIDFKSLVAPVSNDEPAGGGVPFDVREKLEQARKEVNPEAFAADDPLRPTDAIKADWTAIIALSQETLRNTSKNLLVAARLLEALTKKHGFPGLRDGLHLMRLLVEICWDRLDPPLEDDDMEVRAAPFNWLDDPDRGAVFPNSVRAVPLLAADGNQFSWQQWQQSQAGGDMQETIDKIVLVSPRDRCQTLVDNLTQAQQELRFLMQTLTEKMGPDAPGFTVLRPAMSDVLKLAQGILQKKGPPPGPGEEPGTELSVSDGSGQTVVVMAKPRMNTREDIYQELATAASALERLEPHSPVPFLVRRAVELGALPFPLLMQELIRDANVLAEMNRELGIKQRQESGEGG